MNHLKALGSLAVGAALLAVSLSASAQMPWPWPEPRPGPGGPIFYGDPGTGAGKKRAGLAYDAGPMLGVGGRSNFQPLSPQPPKPRVNVEAFGVGPMGPCTPGLPCPRPPKPEPLWDDTRDLVSWWDIEDTKAGSTWPRPPRDTLGESGPVTAWSKDASIRAATPGWWYSRARGRN